LINNASAISLTSVEDTDLKRFDLMHQINTRGTFLVTKECLPYLKKSKHAHVVIMSPPIFAKGEMFSGHIAFTITKYGMSLCTIGMAEEFKKFGIAVNGEARDDDEI
jgi:NAD(P)-dependent dehydrogenase (short-subunit alcohol dehydrogenase family)